MRFFWGIVGAILLFAGMRGFADGSEFDHPHTHLGSTNYEGKVYSWIEVTRIKLTTEETIPLRLLFSVEPPKGLPAFGKFWWCPMVESTIVPVSEGCYLLSTLGGSDVFLTKKKDGTLVSGDLAWTGKIGEKDSVELSSPAGWKYTYRGGKIIDAVSVAGACLHWTYENMRFKSLADSQNGSLLSFEYGAAGLPVRITTPKNVFECEVQKVPVTVDTPAGAIISGLEYSLSAINSKLQTWRFPIELGEDGNYRMPLLVPFQSVSNYVWSSTSGFLKSESGWTYEVTKRDDGRSLVSRKDTKGGVESYFYDDKTGISEHKTPDGRVTIRSYFLALGPTQGKIRKYQELVNGVETGFVQSSYDEVGRLVRQRTARNELIWNYHKNGQLASFEESRDGQNIKRKIYDESGRLTEKFGGLVAYKYAYEAGKTVTQQTINGKVLATKVEDLNTRDSAVFVPTADGALTLKQVSPFPLGNKTTSQEWINSASTLASRNLLISPK